MFTFIWGQNTSVLRILRAVNTLKHEQPMNSLHTIL